MVTTALVALALAAPWSRGTSESAVQPVYYVDLLDGGRAIRPTQMSDGGWALPVDIGAASVTINSGSGVYVLDAGLLNVNANVSGVATAANQSTGNSSLSSIDGKIPALVSGRVPVDGSGVTQPVSGTVGVSGSVAVTGPLTDSQLRATPVPVSGTVTANAGSGTFGISGPVSQSGNWSVRTQDGSGNALASSTSAPAGTEQALIVRNVPSGTQAVSGTFWQATQPVSGTVTANAGSGTFTVSDGTGPMTVDGTVSAAQSGTWTVQPGNTVNTTPWLTEPPKVASANNDGACVSVTTSATVLASNSSRRAASICARISNSDTAYVKLGATATSSDFPLEPGQCLSPSAPTSVYTGVVDAIAASGTQSLCVVEWN